MICLYLGHEMQHHALQYTYYKMKNLLTGFNAGASSVFSGHYYSGYM
jgi:hypothetical protein